MDDQEKKDAIREAAEAKAEEQRTSGKAWQERESQMVVDAVSGDGVDLAALGGKMVNDAFTGQDAAELLGKPAFEASSSRLLEQPLIVVSQDAQFVALNDKYSYGLPDGTELALGEQTNQGVARKALRFVSNLDSKMKTIIEVSQDGETVFEMERKGSIGKNTMVIRDASGNEVGEVKQTKRGSNRASFDLNAGGQTLASMQTGRVRAGGGFDIIDPAGDLVAWVRRLHVGVIGNIGARYKSSPDNYALRMARPLEDPLRTLVVATPMSVDSALNRRDDGLDLRDVKRVIRRFT
jgi:hypothetical protein